MTSLNSLFSIARDGLQAQSAGVTVTGQNITNVNTPGYVRRGVLMQPRQYGGVNVTGVSRSFQRTSHGRLVEEHGRHGAAQVRASALAAVESIVAPGVPTIGDRVNSFHSAGVRKNSALSGLERRGYPPAAISQCAAEFDG